MNFFRKILNFFKRKKTIPDSIGEIEGVADLQTEASKDEISQRNSEIERPIEEDTQASTGQSRENAATDQLKQEEIAAKSPGVLQHEGDDYLDSLRLQLTEKDGLIRKLKKEIEELEDRADEAEYDVKNTKKRLDATKKEQEELKNSFRELENEYTAKKQELETLAEKITRTETELDTRNQSLGFVSEILSAHDANNQDAVKIRRETQDIVDFVQKNICEVFRSASGMTMGELDGIQEEIWQWGNKQRKIWIQNKTVIAFVGEFSAGKTSIVNRILTQDIENPVFKLPVSSAPTTAIATYISYARDTVVQFTDPNENLKNMQMETFSQFSKAKLEKINISKLVRHFVIGYDNEHLKTLSILDTPGFNSNDTEDAERTSEVIHEADALFWVVDSHTGEMTEHSLKIIKEHMKDMPLYIIINKVDDKSPNEREQILNKVKQTMEKNTIPVKDYIKFSKKEPLESIMSVVSIIPLRTEENIIDNIRKRGISLINDYEMDVKEKQKEVRKCQKLINEARFIIENFPNDLGRKKGQIKKINDMLKSDKLLGSTLFGSKNKIKDTERFNELCNERNNFFDEIMELYDKYADACTAELSRETEKLKADEEIKEKIQHVKSLKKILQEFNNIVKPFEAGV